MRERLQKVLARAGLGSRRACEELIAEGRVRVNGEVAELGMRVDPDTDAVEVDGTRLPVAEEHVYIALNKPVGYVTTARDPQGRPTVLDLMPEEPRLFPVGRLDIDTAGLLLLTNDGDFALRMTHPRYGVPKTYVAEVRGSLGQRHLRRLRSGIDLTDGRARADAVRLLGRKADRSLLEIVVKEGRKRMVRRMLDAIGVSVSALVRTQIGPQELGRLKEGSWRKLGGQEVLALLREAEPRAGTAGRRDP